ncbi:MAG: divergent PAP2 family protein [Defluviitaleaceae bacterium]|nr:divergent PAP2 family protein [Defluviitaleaceae bacterium]
MLKIEILRTYSVPAFAIFYNRHIWIALLACISTQALKVLTGYAYNKTINKALFFSTGGMPSSHSALVTALTVSLGVSEGLNSPIFAVALIFSIIIMHDAAGVRRAAGKHAEVINMLVERLESIGITPDKKLKEMLGHTPIEVVAGAIWGVLVASVTQWILLGIIS